MTRFSLVKTIPLAGFAGCLLWAAAGHGDLAEDRADRFGRPIAEVNKCVSTKTVDQDVSVNVPMYETVKTKSGWGLKQVGTTSSPEVCDSDGCRPMYSYAKQVCTAKSWSCNPGEGFTWTEHGCLRRCLPSWEGSEEPRDPVDSRDLKNCASSEACLPLNGEYFCRLPCERMKDCRMATEGCYYGLCTSYKTSDATPPVANPWTGRCDHNPAIGQEAWALKSWFGYRGACVNKPRIGDSKDDWKQFCTFRTKFISWTRVTDDTYRCDDRQIERTIVFGAPTSEGVFATEVSEWRQLNRAQRLEMQRRLERDKAPWGTSFVHRGNKDGCEVYDSKADGVSRTVSVCKRHYEHRATAPATEQPDTVDDKGTAAATGEVVLPDSQDVN